jgi:hypothetical protein
MEILRQHRFGIAGLVLLCAGLVMHPGSLQNVTNVAGLCALIYYAYAAQNLFFFYLEFIVLLGSILKIARVSGIITTIALALAAMLALARIGQEPRYRTPSTLIGACGLIGLVYGYTTFQGLGFVIGGSGLFLYSLLGYRQKVAGAAVFAILNFIYTLIALTTLGN